MGITNTNTECVLRNAEHEMRNTNAVMRNTTHTRESSCTRTQRISVRARRASYTRAQTETEVGIYTGISGDLRKCPRACNPHILFEM